MNRITRYIVRAALASALCAVPAAMTVSCDNAIYDDLEPCRIGANLRFVFDYNMEFANAFPNTVDCLTLYVYDSAGKHVTTLTETTDVLADENWRMTVDLPAGDYHLIAYGGMACDKPSFSFNNVGEGHHFSAMGLSLKPSMLPGDKGVKLHDLYYGTLDLTVKDVTNEYTEATVPMMRDTNNLRILLQQLNGEPLSDSEFTWRITDDNTVYAHDNSVVPAGEVTYLPWATGTAKTGVDGSGNEAQLAWCELSTARFVKSNSPRLIICNASDGKEIVNIPLINYLLLYKSQAHSGMDDQEFLDRENRWNMIFFLDATRHWISTQVVINDWIVRINETDV